MTAYLQPFTDIDYYEPEVPQLANPPSIVFSSNLMQKGFQILCYIYKNNSNSIGGFGKT